MKSFAESAPRILIGDDQADVLEALRLLLKSEGYQIESAASPAAIISALESRDFDVVLVWDTADYLPPELVPALFEKLHKVLRAKGRLLAFFQGAAPLPGTPFARYQLTDSEQLLLLASGTFPFQKSYQTRQIENFLKGYASFRFFLGKDNIREVIAVR